MSIYTLNIFFIAVERGSFVKAAAELNLTPSAVSHAISGLEEEFGFPLFVRKKGGLVLTENGKKIYPYVLEVLTGNDRLSQEIDSINQLSSGIVRIGAFHSVSVEWMPEILKIFYERYPKIEVRIYRGTYRELISMLHDNLIDMCFTVETVTNGFEFIPLLKEPLVCVAPKDFVPLNGNSVTPSELSANRLFIQEQSGSFEAEGYIQKHKIRVSNYLKVDDDNMMLALADKGVGLSIVPEITVSNRNYQVNVFPLKPELNRTIGLVIANPRLVPPAVFRMKETILEYVSRLRT